MTKRIRRNMRRNKRTNPPKQGGQLVHLVTTFDGGPAELVDDCPLCRMLRESGEPVFTVDPFGNLAPLDPTS